MLRLGNPKKSFFLLKKIIKKVIHFQIFTKMTKNHRITNRQCKILE